MWPPIAVVVTRLRGGVAHRLTAVDEQDGVLAVLGAEVISGRDTGDAGTNDRNFYFSIRRLPSDTTSHPHNSPRFCADTASQR